VLGESDFRHHMDSHLKPFRDVLSGVFFVTIGLQLDGAQILSAPLAVLAWLAVLGTGQDSGSTPWPCGRRACPPSMPGAHGHSVGAWRRFALLLLGMVLQQI
jgi:CPA2 family monovalent cation:H+ antiporter-2